MSSEAARRVRSVYLADPGARDALRARWPSLALALDELVNSTPGADGERAFLLERREVQAISDRWRRGPWGVAPGEGR